MSCNGCRVLRKGCSERCILRPCLQWIESPEAQAHATVFVAKFFGRAGLMGFIGAVPENQRPALFQSLLYEACGRTVNPVHGAVGLLWAGNWHACQTAVETVLKGEPLRPVMSNIAFPSPLAPAFGISAAPLLLGQTAADPSNTPQLTLGAPDSALRPLLNGDGSNNSNNKIMVHLDEAAGSSRMEGKKRPRFATDGSTTNWSMSIKPAQPERPLASHQQGEEEEGEEETAQGFASLSMPRITAARSHVTESCNNSAESQYCARKLVAPVPIRPIPWNSTSHYPRVGPLPLKDSVELDLTLNSSHVSSSPFNMGAVLPMVRVSSPSINSEGSVTSSGTIDLPVSPSFHSCGRQERNLLKLMP